jgi:hypothetical protein
MRLSVMTRLVFSVLFCSALAFADGPADRKLIDTVIHSLKTAKPVSSLFTADADSDLGRLQSMEEGMRKPAQTLWPEVGPPVLVVDSMRFLTADIALVNAVEKQIGVGTIRIPLLFVMKREPSGWKIALLRILDASGYTHARPL